MDGGAAEIRWRETNAALARFASAQTVWRVDADDQKLFFMPDRVLVYGQGRYGRSGTTP